MSDVRTTAQLSAAERSKVTDAMIQQIGALTQANNALHAQLTTLKADYDGHIAWHAQQADRSLWQRLSWLVTGR